MRESAPHRARPAQRGSRWPLYVFLLLVAAAAIAAGVFLLGGSKSKGSGTSSGSGATGAAVTLSGARAYDPSGDNSEHDSAAPNATDGNTSTYWDTEHYRSGLGKPGVGLVLDAGSPTALSSLTVQSTTPGFTAEILAGNSVGAKMSVDSTKQTVGSSLTFNLRGAKARYYIVWITDLGSNASVRINEVTAKS